MPEFFDDAEMYPESQPEAEGEGEPTEQPSDIERRLSAAERATQENNLATQLLADPGIREYLSAKQQGRKVKLVADETQQPEKPQPLQEPDWETADSKTIHGYTMQSTQRMLQDALSEFAKPFGEKFSEIEQVLKSFQSQGISSEIDKLRQKYTDFDMYRDDMAAISSRTQGLSIEEMYLMAKTAKGGRVNRPTNQQMSVERPTGTSARPTQRREPVPPGKRGFQQLVTNALKGRDITMIADSEE